MKQVVIVGAGPAGLSAAVSALAGGADVVVLDSSDQIGGQYWHHLLDQNAARDEARLHHDWSRFLEMRAQLESSPRCDIVTSAHVWSIEGLTLRILEGPVDGSNRRHRQWTPDAVIFATGAHDRTLPVPGWDLPGVFSAGAAQVMAKSERVAVGERVAISGSGPFLLPVAAALASTGASVVGVFEAGRPRRLAKHWLSRPWELAASPAKIGEFVGYVAQLGRHRIPYVTGHAITAIYGDECVAAATVSALDDQWRPITSSERTYDVDAVALGHGFVPRLELPLAAGCRLSAQRFVEVDQFQRTSVRNIFAAGEITGIGGAKLAMVEGSIAGYVASGGEVTDAFLRSSIRQRSQERRFAQRIEGAHAVQSGWTSWLTPDTTICRCEEVSYEALIASARSTQSRGLRSLKLSTRVGLGLCQGRVCGRTAEELFAAQPNVGQLLGPATFDRRPFATTVRLGELATLPIDSPPYPQDS